jgi:hypothetical protein
VYTRLARLVARIDEGHQAFMGLRRTDAGQLASITVFSPLP